MTPEFGDEPVKLKRLLMIAVPILVLLGAALLLLPFSIQKAIAAGVIALPVLLFLFDRPKWIFYILLLITFSNLDIFAPFRMFRYVLFLFIASFAVAVVHGRKIVVHDRLFVILTTAFFILMFQSITVARDLDASLYTLNDFVKVLVNIAITIQFVTNRVAFRHFIIVIVIGMLFNSLLPFIVKPPTEFRYLSLLWEEGVLRYEGYTLEANRFALYLNFSLPLLLFLMITYRRPRIVRPVLLLAFFASIFVLVLSFSRAGFISLILLLFLLVIIERRNRMVFSTGVIIIVLGIVIAPAVYWERIYSIVQSSSWESADYAIITRIEAMKAAFDMGIKHPILGVGVHNFMHRVTAYMPLRMIVHNTFLQVFSEMGLIAFSVFICLIVYNIRIALGFMKRPQDREANQVGRILLIQQIVVLFNSMSIPVAYDRVFWFLMALPSLAKYAYRPGASVPAGAGAPETT